jgi:3'-phosphoadenosine 5'-phosphosulfate sulfotransferase (PAPS reductase)/FAD synthetase
MKRIVNFSGGKNSTAMLLYLLERDIEIDYVVFMDTTIEFKETLEFVKRVDEFLQDYGLQITRLRPNRTFMYYVLRKPIVKGWRKGKYGYGIPTPKNRWCCKVLKREPFVRFLVDRDIKSLISYTGFTVEEKSRVAKSDFGVVYTKRYGIQMDIQFPLYDAGLTDQDCYELCKKYGLLNPIYEKFDRQGCVICPFHSISDWRHVYHYYPKWFKIAEKLEKQTGRTFRLDYSLSQLREKFEKEDMQVRLSEFGVW